MFVKFSFIAKLITAAIIIGGLTFIRPPDAALAADNCSITYSGVPVYSLAFLGVEMPAGSTLTVVLNSGPGLKTGILAVTFDFSTVLIESESDKSPHAASYTATKDTLVVLLLGWEDWTHPSSTFSITLSGCGEGGEAMAGPPATNLLDGRLNNSQLKDVAAPVAVYCADGNIDIYKINAETGDGTRVISVPQVEGLPESGTNTELASAEGVSLYWLSDGPYQINTPNFEGILYSITWEGCDSSTLVHLAPQP